MPKHKILAVDDEKDFTWMLKLSLEATGMYDVRVENSPLQALKAVEEFHPDIILMDVIMPGMEGPQVAAQMRANPAMAQTPIVFLTATVTREDIEAQGGKIDGQIFIPKPIPLDALLKTISGSLAAI